MTIQKTACVFGGGVLSTKIHRLVLLCSFCETLSLSQKWVSNMHVFIFAHMMYTHN